MDGPRDARSASMRRRAIPRSLEEVLPLTPLASRVGPLPHGRGQWRAPRLAGRCALSRPDAPPARFQRQEDRPMDVTVQLASVERVEGERVIATFDLDSSATGKVQLRIP